MSGGGPGTAGEPRAVRAAVVTGASSGIGRWIALGLAQAGYRLVLPVRDEARAGATRDWLMQREPGAALEFVFVDLASVAGTRAAAREIAGRHPRLTLLVNNAGVFLAHRERTAEGHDKVLAVNHLAPFVLMRELAPVLAAGAPSRIVTTGSSTSDRARIDPTNLDLEHGWRMVRAYSQSKLAVMMATFETARRLVAQGITANVVHPGMVATSLVRTPGLIGMAWRLMAPLIRTEQQGAATPLHVALADELAGTTGQYFKDQRPATPNPLVRDPALVHAVWQATEKLVGAG